MAYKIKPIEVKKCYAPECTRPRAPGDSYCKQCKAARRKGIREAKVPADRT